MVTWFKSEKNTSRHRDFQIWILLSSPWRCTLQETITWTRKIHRLKHALVREALRIQDYPEISWGWGWNPEKKHSSKGFGFLAKCSKLKAFSRALVAYCIQHVHQKFPSPILFPKKPGNKSHTREDHPRTCKWSANPRYKPWKGHDLLTMVFNHLQVTSHGMILQVFTANSPEFARRHWCTFASDTSIFASLGIVPTVSTLHQLPSSPVSSVDSWISGG